jgi:hypothetical protein
MNDPAAGSPTATLLRLLPCQDPKYRYTSQPRKTRVAPCGHSVKLYLGPFRGSDGRCVQEPGTYSLRPDETRIQDIPRSWRIITSINPHHDSGSKDSPDPSIQAVNPNTVHKAQRDTEARWLNQCSARAAQNI